MILLLFGTVYADIGTMIVLVSLRLAEPYTMRAERPKMKSNTSVQYT